LREDCTTQLYNFHTSQRFRQVDLIKIVQFSPLNTVYTTDSKIIFFQMNWSTRRKSLRLSLTNLTKPSLKCRVTKPCNVTENSYAIIILSSTFEMSSKMSRRLKNLFVTFAKYFAMCQFTNRKVQLNIFSVHSFLNLISKPIERDCPGVRTLQLYWTHCT